MKYVDCRQHRMLNRFKPKDFLPLPPPYSPLTPLFPYSPFLPFPLNSFPLSPFNFPYPPLTSLNLSSSTISELRFELNVIANFNSPFLNQKYSNTTLPRLISFHPLLPEDNHRNPFYLQLQFKSFNGIITLN